MFLGPMDFTPGAMLNATRKDFAPVFDRPMSLGTRCHQLAMYVVFESPLQMLADSPSNYLREPETMEFLAPVPSVWDDTRVLDARIADYVVVARRSGNDWYVGAMTDWTARDLEVDFSFLPGRNLLAGAYQDGVNADRIASDYKKTKTKITRDTKLKISLAPGGGWAARIHQYVILSGEERFAREAFLAVEGPLQLPRPPAPSQSQTLAYIEMPPRLQACPDCSDIPSPLALCSKQTSKPRRTSMGTILIVLSGASPAGRASDMAIQRQLGILPKWRARTGFADRGHPGAYWQGLTARLFLALLGVGLESGASSRCTSARIWVHSETTFPATCPHLESGSACL